MHEILLSPAELRFSLLILYFCLRLGGLAMGKCLRQCA